MNIQFSSDIIISLIKDDLINSKLVNSLSTIGLNASDYHLHLSTTILRLMGFNNDSCRDEIFALYFELSKKAMPIHISELSVAFDNLAHEIYQKLKEKSIGC